LGTCKFCGKSDKLISNVLEICRDCILNQEKEKVKEYVLNVHKQIRKTEELPGSPPDFHDPNAKVSCKLCVNECSLGEGEISYCGLRMTNKDKSKNIPMPSRSLSYMHGYLDMNPTNCCNSWFCPAGTANGHPKYSDFPGPEIGTYSYAAFMYGCSFDCLFCQNASHKHFSRLNIKNTEDYVNEFIQNKKITCVCYFGGTPECQFLFTISASEKILEKLQQVDPKRKMRICWEWNGSGNPKHVERCMQIAIKSGGNVKFDLKSYHEILNLALCGVSNKRTYENFKFLAEKYFGTRPNVPEMSGCTLLVPGYTIAEEVEKIAQFIASINKDIPYSLLVFHPDYMMRDLPITPKKQAYKCLEVAKKHLNNVHLGNQFLLKF
jgi:pyruvate formate lyase activating enzyme